jgi:hypothetical protein
VLTEQNVFTRYVAQGLSPKVKSLTLRLLKRVRNTKEKEFANGRFLLPSVIRYDGLSKSGDDKPCTFFNFPYFCVQDPGSPTSTRGTGPEHPVRTLLQSRYRLENTGVRDGLQSITTLSQSEVNKCVRSQHIKLAQHSAGSFHAIIHVPQLWGMSLSGGMTRTPTVTPCCARAYCLRCNTHRRTTQRIDTAWSIFTCPRSQSGALAG